MNTLGYFIAGVILCEMMSQGGLSGIEMPGQDDEH